MLYFLTQTLFNILSYSSQNGATNANVDHLNDTSEQQKDRKRCLMYRGICYRKYKKRMKWKSKEY